jgi:NodT family efflux transporter outer membrane factor (OMF) lipoprotein
MRLVQTLILSLTIGMLAGCAVGPDYRRPDAPTSTEYTAAPQADSGTDGQTQRLVRSMDIPGQWWTLFRSAPLDALIDDALKHNPDVEAARAALQVAQENAYAERGAYFPSVSAGFNPTRQKNAGDVASALTSDANLYSLTTAQVSVSYAPDLWGGTRRQVESALAQAQAQRFQLEATYLTLTSNLVNAAIEEASLRAQIDTTLQMIEMQTTVLTTLRRQQALGDVDEATVAAQVTVLEETRQALPPLRKQLNQQRDLLAALTGRMPDERIDAQFELDGLQLPAELPLSLPAQLVEQRPDVRASEAELHAASAAIGVAIADRLPNVQLDASLGSASERTSSLFTAGTGFWSIGAGVTQPLFDAGALKHKQRAAEAGYRQAAAQYRSTVIAAAQNVADVLHAIQADAQALAAAERAERAAMRSLQIARKQLALGDISQSSLLIAELAWRQAGLTLIQARAARFADTVALFQALGGGWWNRAEGRPEGERS